MGRHAAEHQGGAEHPPLPGEGTDAAIRSGGLTEGRQEGEETRRSPGLSGDAALGDVPSKGLRRLALVSGVSVVLTLGLIVGGVRVLSGRTELTVQPSGASCAAPNQCSAEQAADTVPTDGRQTSDGPASPAPTISAGQTPLVSHSATPGVTPSPATSTTTSATPGTTAVPEPGNSPTRAVTQTPAGTTPSASSPVLGAAPPPPSPDGGASVPATTQPAAPNRVRVSVELFSRGYRAEVTVHNEAADLDSWAVDLPLGAKIAGAYSNQGGVKTQGSTIVSSRPLRSGRDITVTIFGYGSFRSPGGCSLAGGECTVSSR
ncbi:hypothetical protein [Planotetraspora mira]|uniref:CBM2 domain-containing protein n=1 Tax=Planotetraspora mira TaxID=58121 RepID=A0A8J3TRF6_9ACTN|nr:hypothetical protein [Planotetraspora mira]GII31675.1 hypothetical protein Pmi06nite_51170 [Planotetraspora mira]